MARFNPAMLIPAHQVEGLAKAPTQRTTQQIALDNIERMRAEFVAPEQTEGRKSWKVVGDRVAFSIRVSNTALVLAEVDVPGSETRLAVREMTVPSANFGDALDFYADRIKSGEYQAQLEALSGKREARTSKMRETRAAKTAEKPA